MWRTQSILRLQASQGPPKAGASVTAKLFISHRCKEAFLIHRRPWPNQAGSFIRRIKGDISSVVC